MKKHYLLPVSFLLVAAGFALAIKVGEKPNTPKLPDVEWVVHDGTRPQPRIVKTEGVVVVSPPADAKVLIGKEGNEAWANKDWKNVDGVMTVAKGPNQSNESFRDVQMHVEWRIPADRKVEGQIGGNSGIFFMGLYEVQVLASHNNPAYPDGQAGGMYGQYPPLVNATAPQGEWNSYDIIFKAPRYDGEKVIEPAKLTLFHNGVLLHNAKEYMGPTEHKRLAEYPKEHPERAPISLQDHNDPVQFRNMWVREVGEYDQP